MTDQFSQLKKHTVIVADTGDINAFKKYQPTDATTNPSLILAAASDPSASYLIDAAIEWGSSLPGDRITNIMDCCAVTFGCEIARIVPGVVSTEVDARLSFDTEASIAKAKRLIQLYASKGVDKSRILIKLSSTWEGIQAAKQLESEGIHCNMTLLFSMPQAIAASNVKATLISPFVGRILDWFVANTETKKYEPDDDPGVKSVREIYKYFKSTGSKTIVMGASFRNKGQVLALAGCDKLTISPKFLEELKSSTDPVKLALDHTQYNGTETPRSLTEQQFRWELNEDAMATEKLAQGIRTFAADSRKLEVIIQKLLDSKK